MNTTRRLWPALAAAVLALASGACAGSESGALPEGPPQGSIVALTFDAPSQRLLKAYARALYQSRDGGRSWQGVPLPPSVQRGAITAVAAPPQAVGTLYVAGPGFGVLKTTDAGAHWQPLNEGLPTLAITAFATHSQLDTTLYAFVEGEGVYRTENGGRHWKRMDRGPGGTIRQLIHSNLAGSMNTGWLYVAAPTGVHRAMDCFCGWRRAGSLPDSGGASSVVFDPAEAKRLFAAGDHDLFSSPDGGENWQAMPEGPPETVALAVDPGSGVLYAATRDGVVLQSRDRGAHWRRTGG